MNPATRESLSGDEHSDYESVLTEPVSDEETLAPLRLEPDAQQDGGRGVRQSSGALLAMQVQHAAARAGESSGGTNSPQLDPLRQLQVGHQAQQGPAAPQQQAVAAQALLDEHLRHEEQLQRQRRYQEYQMQLVQLRQQRERELAEEQDGDVGVGLVAGQLRPLRYACKSCPARFTHVNLMSRHISEQHPVQKPFPCPDCDRGYVNREGLEAHYLTVHRGERPFPCDQCDKVFSRPEYLRTHSRVHTGYKPYSCPFCPRRFAWKDSIDYHIRTHTGERPYLCVRCQRDFRGLSALKFHEMVHDGRYPSPCTQCERRFRRPVDLRHHVEAEHQDNDEEAADDVSEDGDQEQAGGVTREEQDAAIAAVLPVPANEVQILQV